MNKKLIWLSLFALTLVIGQPTYACATEKNSSKQCHCNDNKKLTTQLNLTDEQKVKIKAIRIQARQHLKTNYKQLKALQLQINALVTAEKIDEAKLDSIISQRNKIKGTLLKSHVLMQHQIYTLLTDKQKLQYKEIKIDHKHKHS